MHCVEGQGEELMRAFMSLRIVSENDIGGF